MVRETETMKQHRYMIAGLTICLVDLFGDRINSGYPLLDDKQIDNIKQHFLVWYRFVVLFSIGVTLTDYQLSVITELFNKCIEHRKRNLSG